MTGALKDYEYMDIDDFEELLLDRPENEKWELIGGRVIRGMVGARWEHNRIIQNLSSQMMQRFRQTGSSCRTFNETFWLKEKAIDLKVFPDILVRCKPLAPGAVEMNDPVVIVEVLSPGGEVRDRIEKWSLYRKLPSLQHYVLIGRDEMHVELFNRGDEAWEGFRAFDAPDALLQLPAIDFEVKLADIYWDVLSPGETTSQPPICGG